MSYITSLWMRVVSAVVLVSFTWTFAGVFDVAYAAKDGLTPKAQAARPGQASPAAKLQKALKDIEDALGKPGQAEVKAALKAKKAELKDIDKAMRQQFSATEKHLKDKNLPEKIIKRHNDFVSHYEKNFKELRGNMDAVLKARTSFEFKDAVGKTKKHLIKVKPPSKHVPLDPNKLPHRAAKPTKKKPRTKAEDFLNDLRAENEILVASTGPLTGLMEDGSNYLQLASATGAPTQADLDETIDVQFTNAITAKAAELGNNPVTIYNWVRNNVEFAPTYGSIQGADYCLQTMQCNAFDTASLLIALLRVSGIHARYVQGTVEVPVEKAMNWAGGFTNATAALDFMATGGIPATGLVEAGKIKIFRLEHVWVEAYVDMVPSRGARHRQGDTWTPLDASFKQYTYTQGMDLSSTVPFDAETLVGDIINSATINEDEGWVTGIDSSIINSAMSDYQAQVEAYMTDNHPDATVGDVLGTKKINQQDFRIFMGTLPYKLRAVGARYAGLPGSLRHKITFSVTTDNIYYDTQSLMITKSLPEIAGKKITLSYSPATQADEDVINSYLPAPHPDGTPIDPSELPSSLPAYMINLVPELRVDGLVVATGGAIGMGSTENVKMVFHDPARPDDVVSNIISAGEYWGIAVDVSAVSQKQLEDFKAKLENTKAKLEAEEFAGLTKEDMLGDLLYTTAMAYNAEMDVFDKIQARTMGVASIRVPSEAIFKTSLSVEESWGVPVSAGASGLTMDVDRLLSMVKGYDGDNSKKVEFLLTTGMQSSTLEHSVPEKLFSTPDNPVEGVSAVKALQIASSKGIPIFTVNKDNIANILPQLQLDATVINEIRNAVNAGNEVTVSKTDINYFGWAGSGFIVINPTSGEGAYMISSGESGAKLVEGIAMLVRSILPLQSSSVFDSSSEAIGLILEGLGGIIGFWADYLWDCYIKAIPALLNSVFGLLEYLPVAIVAIAVVGLTASSFGAIGVYVGIVSSLSLGLFLLGMGCTDEGW